LLPEFLPDQLSRERPAPQAAPIAATWEALAADLKVAIASDERGVYRRALEHFDRIVIGAVMTQTKGNQVAAAELLGLSRPTLRDKLRRIQRDAELAPDLPIEINKLIGRD
jgi:DNA-binding protein Fis